MNPGYAGFLCNCVNKLFERYISYSDAIETFLS